MHSDQMRKDDISEAILQAIIMTLLPTIYRKTRKLCGGFNHALGVVKKLHIFCPHNSR